MKRTLRRALLCTRAISLDNSVSFASILQLPQRLNCFAIQFGWKQKHCANVLSSPLCTFALPHGVNVVADGVTLDLNGAVLVGSGTGTGAGVTVIGRHGVTVTSSRLDAGIRGYFYGVVGIEVSMLTLSHLNVSGNWKDPKASTVWLNINAPPSLLDKVCDCDMLS